MGLLDEAIRDHLELKRRHGADLQEVARIEEDALGSDDGAAAAGHNRAERAPAEGFEASAGYGRGAGQQPPVDPEDYEQAQLPGVAGAQGRGSGGSYGDDGAQETTEIEIGSTVAGHRIGARDGAYDRELESDWAAATGEQSDEFEWEAPRSAGR